MLGSAHNPVHIYSRSGNSFHYLSQFAKYLQKFRKLQKRIGSTLTSYLLKQREGLYFRSDHLSRLFRWDSHMSCHLHGIPRFRFLSSARLWGTCTPAAASSHPPTPTTFLQARPPRPAPESSSSSRRGGFPGGGSPLRVEIGP